MLVTYSAIGQTTESKRIIANDSLKIKTNWIKSILTDTALTGATSRDIASADAIKTYIANRLALVVKYGDTAALVAGYVRETRFLDSLAAVQGRLNTKLTKAEADTYYPAIQRLIDTANVIQARINANASSASSTYVPKTTTVNGHALSSNITVTQSDIGLGNVNNTSDVNKPISTATQTALDGKVPTTRTVNGHALSADVTVTKSDVGLSNVPNTDATNAANISSGTLADGRLSSNVTLKGNSFNGANQLPLLDGSGKLVASVIPALALVDTYTPASQAAMLALPAEQGDFAIRTDINAAFVLYQSPASTLSNWIQLPAPSSETDPIFTAHVAYGITSTNISNWNTAYGWGNHASAGYTTASNTQTFTNKSGNISQWTNNVGYLTSYTETDPTIYSWAKASTKPSYTYSEVGAAATSHTHTYSDLTGTVPTWNQNTTGNAATATTASNWGVVPNSLNSPAETSNLSNLIGISSSNGYAYKYSAAAVQTWLGLGSYAYRSAGLAELSGATFTGNVAGTGFRGTSFGINLDGSNTASAGPYFFWANSANTRQWLSQLDASNNLGWWYYNGSAYIKYLTFGTSGQITTGSIASLGTIVSASSQTAAQFNGGYYGNSGGDYHTIGYNVGFTSTSGQWNYVYADYASFIRFQQGGFEFWGAPASSGVMSPTIKFRVYNNGSGELSGQMTATSFVGAGTGLTGTASALNIGGQSLLLGSSGSSLTAQRGNGTVAYEYAVTNPQTGLFSAIDNSNSILTLNRHPGDYYSQLGFSSNGNIYYRRFSGNAINTSQGWDVILTSANYTSYAMAGAGYSTNQNLNTSSNVTFATIDASLIRSTGDVIAYYSSDRRFKNNIRPINNALNAAAMIGGYSFDWNDKQDIYIGHDYGVIAQDVERYFPELVTTRSNGYKAVKYDKLPAVAFAALREAKERIEALEADVKKLKRK